MKLPVAIIATIAGILFTAMSYVVSAASLSRICNEIRECTIHICDMFAMVRSFASCTPSEALNVVTVLIGIFLKMVS